jgi:hypothetical protein
MFKGNTYFFRKMKIPHESLFFIMNLPRWNGASGGPGGAAVSADGKVLVVTRYEGGIWTSSDQGETWVHAGGVFNRNV